MACLLGMDEPEVAEVYKLKHGVFDRVLQAFECSETAHRHPKAKIVRRNVFM